jgi:hypothetical protein
MSSMNEPNLRLAIPCLIFGAAMSSGCTPPVDLFACDLPLTCEEMYWHTTPQPPSAFTCAADLIISGERGVLRAVDDPGGDEDVVPTETLVITIGNRMGIVQTREGKDAPSAQQICSLLVDPKCQPGDCRWEPWGDAIHLCEDAPERTCQDVAKILE